MCNSLAIVPGQQIAPDTIIGIVDSALHRTQRTGGTGILFMVGNIARIVIGPDPGFSHRLICLPCLLVALVLP